MAHAPRHLTAPPPFIAGACSIKPYHVNIDDEPIDERLVAATYAMLAKLLPEPDRGTPPVAFVVVHRGRHALYVNAYAWVWDNVLHMRSAAGAEPFLGCPDDDPTHLVVLEQRFIGCIWELPPLEHERAAWVRHVFDADTPDVAAYVADAFPSGPVGI